MPHLTEFLTHHPYLTAATFAAAVAVLVYELRARAQDFAALSATQAVRLINEGALVLDLRAKELYDAGHIGDARHVPADQLESQADSLKKWRERNVIIYCDSGQTGSASARTLNRLGFTKVFNLQGGVSSWVKDNLPLVRSKGGK